jgi:hypothetical protein
MRTFGAVLAVLALVGCLLALASIYKFVEAIQDMKSVMMSTRNKLDRIEREMGR